VGKKKDGGAVAAFQNAMSRGDVWPVKSGGKGAEGAGKKDGGQSASPIYCSKRGGGSICVDRKERNEWCRRKKRTAGPPRSPHNLGLQGQNEIKRRKG